MKREITQKLIPINQIDMGLRARKTYEAIDDLIQSIRSHGLIQPIAVVDKTLVDHWEGIDEESLNDDKRYLLLAGGRRMTAFRKGDIAEKIPARIYDEHLSADEMKSIELYENLHRVGLSWQEEVSLKEEIHNLQVKLHGKPVRGTSNGKGHRVEDTAEMLGEAKSTVSADINLAKAIKKMPQLAGAKNKSEAAKMLRKLKEDVDKETRAKRIEKQRAETPLDKQREKLRNSYIVGPINDDMFDSGFFYHAKNIDSGTFDTVELDPPYAIALEEQKKASRIVTDDYDDIHTDFYEVWMENMLSECYRILKPNGWIICWFGPDPWFDIILRLMRQAGFEVRGLPGIWNKGRGQTQQPTRYLGNGYEMFFYGRKGHAAIKDQGRLNVYDYPPVNAHKKDHPTERPIEMIQDVIQTFTEPSGRVIVPCAGSGNTMLACSNLGIFSVGYDIKEKFRNDYVVKVDEGVPGEYKSYK